MTDLRSKRKDGVRTLADLRSRCVISDETDCWIWRGATSRRRNAKGNPSGQPAGRVWLPDTGKAETTVRASWLLSGRSLGPGEVVWHHRCTEPLCINPDHCRAGTKQRMYAAMIADGRLRGNPRRAAVNARNRSVQLLPVETVRKAEAMFAAGAMQKTVRAELCICPGVAARIRKGLHPHCSSAQRVIYGASVFALGGRG